MNNPRLAGRYAKSLIDLATELNQVDDVCADIKFIQSICKSNPDFVSVLRSPIIKPDTKEKIIEEANETQRELDLVSLNISNLDDVSNLCKYERLFQIRS